MLHRIYRHTYLNKHIVPLLPPILLSSSSSCSMTYQERYIQESDILSLLQTYTHESPSHKGETCHSHLLKRGFLPHTSTANSLLHFYSKQGLLLHAHQLFDEMPELSKASWNTLISSHVRQNDTCVAFHLLLLMISSGFTPNEFTISTILSACAINRFLQECLQLHAIAHKSGCVSNLFVATALLDVYAKCELMNDAFSLFSSMAEKSSVTWSSILSGFVQNKLFDEALATFHESINKGTKHDEFTISSVLSASANLATLSTGRQLHCLVQRTGLSSNCHILSSLIDMYSKCGTVDEAFLVFSMADRDEKKNVVIWNSMISGLSRHGLHLQVMVCFEKMQQMGVLPDDKTFLSVLNACGHVGKVEEALVFFNMMVKEHHISPNVIHYSCMVDALGRLGRIGEARELTERMPEEASVSAWGAVLAACRKEGVLEGAEDAAEVLFENEVGNGGTCVLLSEVYASSRRWEEVADVRRKVVGKEKGESWVEANGSVHSFMVGERGCEDMDEVYLRLEELMTEVKDMGGVGRGGFLGLWN